MPPWLFVFLNHILLQYNFSRDAYPCYTWWPFRFVWYRKMMPLSPPWQNSLHLPRQVVQSSLSMVCQSPAYRISLLKDNYGCELNLLLRFSFPFVFNQLASTCLGFDTGNGFWGAKTSCFWQKAGGFSVCSRRSVVGTCYYSCLTTWWTGHLSIFIVSVGNCFWCWDILRGQFLRMSCSLFITFPWWFGVLIWVHVCNAVLCWHSETNGTTPTGSWVSIAYIMPSNCRATSWSFLCWHLCYWASWCCQCTTASGTGDINRLDLKPWLESYAIMIYSCSCNLIIVKILILINYKSLNFFFFPQNFRLGRLVCLMIGRRILLS